MDLARTVSIAAPPEAVWAVLADLERWPEWTASMRKVEPLDSPPFRIGARVRISQPRAPRQIWTISDLQEGRTFSWEARSLGVRSIAGHAVERVGEGSEVTVSIRQSGVGAHLLGLWLRRVTARYLEIEAAGLKARCESS